MRHFTVLPACEHCPPLLHRAMKAHYWNMRSESETWWQGENDSVLKKKNKNLENSKTILLQIHMALTEQGLLIYSIMCAKY